MYGAAGLPRAGRDVPKAIVQAGMMNRFERLFGLKGEARVTYLAGEYRVDAPGDFVICAVTGKPIALGDLRYWSVELQEPYASAEASLARHQEIHGSSAGHSGARGNRQ